MKLLPTLLLSVLLLAPPDGTSREAHEANQEGVRLFEAGEFREAAALFRKAREMAPKNEAIRKNLGNCLLEIGAKHLHANELEEAVSVLDEAVDLIPGDGEAHYRLGVAYFKRQRYADAASRLEHAVRLEPTHAQAHLWLGRSYYESGDIERSVPPLEEALRLSKKQEKAEDEREIAEFLDRVRREAKVEKDFVQDYSEHFLIQASGKVAFYVREQVRRELEDAFSDVAADLDYNPDVKIPAILYSEKEFRDVTGSHEWVGGVFDGKIRIPVKDFDKHREELMRVIRHEVTHALVRVSIKDAPRWYNEGLAQYFAVSGIPAAAVVKNGKVVWRGHPARINDEMLKGWM